MDILLYTKPALYVIIVLLIIVLFLLVRNVELRRSRKRFIRWCAELLMTTDNPLREDLEELFGVRQKTEEEKDDDVLEENIRILTGRNQ